MNDIASRLTKCFSAAFPKIPPQDIPQASTQTVSEWDSLALVVLVSLIEEEFKVQVAPSDLDSFASYAGVLEYLQKKFA